MSLKDLLESQGLEANLQAIYVDVAANNGLDVTKKEFKNFLQDVYSMNIETQLCSLGYLLGQIHPRIQEEQLSALILKMFSEVMKDCYLKSSSKGATNEEILMPAMLITHWVCLAGEERSYSPERYAGTTSSDGRQDDGITSPVLDFPNRKH